jgi:hypothetical protein
MALGNLTYDMEAQNRALQLCLTADKRPLGFLLGAGCPLSIRIEDAGLIPDIKGLTTKVRASLKGYAEHNTVLEALDRVCDEDGISAPTVEDFLNRLRNIHAVGGKEAVRGITPGQAAETDQKICQLIKAEVEKELPDAPSPYRALARWMGGISRTAPVEIFTPNYDLLFEQALEEGGVPYFDGFSGVRRAFLDLESMERDGENAIPARWARLWKLHGSVNWHRDRQGNVWRGAGSGEDNLLVYPSHDKYMQSRRMPFLAMMDRLKAFLSRPEAVLVICGYSFADEHINALLRDGLRGNSRSVVFGLVHKELVASHPAISLAKKAPNFLLLAGDAAVIGGNHGKWSVPEGKTTPPEFSHGDFANLGTLLSSISGQIEGKPMIQHAAGADISGNR